MRPLILLMVLVFLASACATDRNLTKHDLVEMGKNLGPGTSLVYTRSTEIEMLKIEDKSRKGSVTIKRYKKKPKEKQKVVPTIKIEGR